MRDPNNAATNQRVLLARYWQTASLFWFGRKRWPAWSLTIFLVAVVLLQLFTQYLMNFWNRDFFNALELRDGHQLWFQTQLLVPLLVVTVALAAISVWGRMTAQRLWRQNLTTCLIDCWLAKDNYRKLDYTVAGRQNPEYRIAEDARVATDVPVDLALGLLSSILVAITFLEILWNVGGGYMISAFGVTFFLPGYLVFGVTLYSVVFTGAMILTGRPLTEVIQAKNQAEAELRANADLLREVGEGFAPPGSDTRRRRAVWIALRGVLVRWRDLMTQLTRLTLVSQSNFILAPIAAWLLCAPKYLLGAMTLGELTQAAVAFVTVQGAFNWLVDNYQRSADWISSVNRVATFLIALDEVDRCRPAGSKRVNPAPIEKKRTRATVTGSQGTDYV